MNKILNKTIKEGMEKIGGALAAQKSQEEVFTVIGKILECFKGNEGKTPQKGVDYMTESERTEFVQQVYDLIDVPKAGKDFFTAEEKKTFIKEVQKALPKFGVDYYTPAERAKFLKDANAQVQKHINSFAGEKSTFLDKVKKEVADMKKAWAVASQKALEGLEERLADPRIIKIIVRGIEALKGNDRLNARKLKNLPESFTINSIQPMPAGVAVVDVSSQLNGVLKTFTVPANSAILMVIVTGWPPNGVLRPTVDFTAPTSTSIALTSQVSAPDANSSMIVLYIAA